jgi:hypothetical protein
MLEVRIYNKQVIDDFIRDYEKSKKAFEICGKFLGNHYIIAEDEYSDNSPFHKLKEYIDKEYSFGYEEFLVIKYNYLVTEITDDDFKEDEELIKEIDDKIENLENEISSLKKKKEKVAKRTRK